MVTRRSFVVSLALVALVSILSMSSAIAQPRNIAYMGMLRDDHFKPLVGIHNIKIDYYTADTKLIYTEDFQGAVVGPDGVFFLILGSTSPTGFPAFMDFTYQYFLGLTVDGVAMPARMPMLSVPYAINSFSVGFDALQASKTPTNGKLWPVPLDSLGKIESYLMPAPAMPMTASGLLIAGSMTLAMPGVKTSDFVMVSRGPVLGTHPGNLTAMPGYSTVTVMSDNPLDDGAINVMVVSK